jgi:site-specific DNA recombinase
VRQFIGYIRVSTDDQAESGLGLAAQRHALEMYAQLYNLELTDVIVDDGYSGKDLERPGIQELLRRLESGSVAGVLISKLDRLSRSVKDAGGLVERYFADGSARLVSVGEQIDTGTASGRLVLHVLISVAQWEREATSERTTAALAVKRARGERTSYHIPYGLRLADDGVHLVEDETEQLLLARIRVMHREGLSTRRIADLLTAEGVPCRGARWHFVTIAKIVREGKGEQQAA